MQSLLGLLLLSLALTGCQGQALPVSPAALQQVVRSAQAALTPAAPMPGERQPAAPAQPTAVPVTPAADAAASAAAAAEGSAAGGSIPTALTVPAINLGAEVAPMGWELIMAGGQITTRWAIPLDTLGWAINSAAAGAPGNMVIIGYQAEGSALLRPLALGEVLPGQEIRVRAANGVTYLYQVSEVSPPIPAFGATAEEMARAAAYLAPSTDARLTLVSGWPADITTHRLFVVAEFTGSAP